MGYIKIDDARIEDVMRSVHEEAHANFIFEDRFRKHLYKKPVFENFWAIHSLELGRGGRSSVFAIEAMNSGYETAKAGKRIDLWASRRGCLEVCAEFHYLNLSREETELFIASHQALVEVGYDIFFTHQGEFSPRIKGHSDFYVKLAK